MADNSDENAEAEGEVPEPAELFDGSTEVQNAS